MSSNLQMVDRTHNFLITNHSATKQHLVFDDQVFDF